MEWTSFYDSLKEVINKNNSLSNAEKVINGDAEVYSSKPKKWQRQKISLINLIIIIYFTNHQQRQLVDFLNKYPCKKLPWI